MHTEDHERFNGEGRELDLRRRQDDVVHRDKKIADHMVFEHDRRSQLLAGCITYLLCTPRAGSTSRVDMTEYFRLS